MQITRFADIRALMADMPQADVDAIHLAQARDSQLTKPPGSLGKLEHLAIWLSAWQGAHPPRADKLAFYVFAGNHGVTAQGISAFPAEVTFQMVANFESGGAAINQLARLADADLFVIPLELDRPTADFTAGPAMSEAETCEAFAVGFQTINKTDLACIGEMGIGNTTVAAALAAALYGGTGEDWAGPGTGLDIEGVNHKAEVIDRALALHQEHLGDPLEALARLGGREIAAMAGAILACRMKRVPVLLDGYVNCAAAAVLACMDPGALDHCRASHRSAEPAAGKLLSKMDFDRGLEPLLDLDMRLGEASGAATAALLIKAAVATHTGMATFAEAGVAAKEG
jgi:nicotinate-nucleotide--dimethylbenzimidazole phosphoribosyltransferase